MNNLKVAVYLMPTCAFFCLMMFVTNNKLLYAYAIIVSLLCVVFGLYAVYYKHKYEVIKRTEIELENDLARYARYHEKVSCEGMVEAIHAAAEGEKVDFRG